KLAPKLKDVYALYQTEGSPAGGHNSTLNVGTLVNNIDYLEQQNLGTLGPSESARNNNDCDDDTTKDIIRGLFLDDENNITLKKKTKTHNYLGLQQYTTSPNKPRLDDDDVTTLRGGSLPLSLSSESSTSLPSLSLSHSSDIMVTKSFVGFNTIFVMSAVTLRGGGAETQTSVMINLTRVKDKI
ncbi:hypothetical protein, partial, partial [Absidia glauca]